MLVLAPEIRQSLGILRGLGISELALDRGRPVERLRQPAAKTQAVLPYFCRNRSTRPAVSTSFCLPVKKGWQAEQISVWISAWVDRVSKVLPQAQITVAVAYSG
jgi:hypothetical protein